MNQRSPSLIDNPRSAPKLLELDAAAIAQTKVQIGKLVAEIAELTKTCEAPSVFYAAMLCRLVTAMAGSGAGVWQRLDDGSWRLLQAFTLPESLVSDLDNHDLNDDQASPVQVVDRLATLVDSELDSNPTGTRTRSKSKQSEDKRLAEDSRPRTRGPTPEHLALLDCVAREQQPILVPPGDIAVGGDRPTNPIQQCLIYSPIPVEAALGRFWLQVVQPPSGGVATQRGFLRFVAQIADLTADFLKTYRLRQFENEQRLFAAAKRLLNDAAKPGDAKAKLSILVDQLRELTGADQVILVQRAYGYQSWQISIASGLNDFDARSEGSQCLAELIQWITRQWPHHRPWVSFSSDRRANDSNHDQLNIGDGLPRERFLSMFSAAAVAWLPLFGGTSKKPNGVGCVLYWSWPAKRPENAALEQLAERAQTLGRLGLDAIRPAQLQNAIDRSERKSQSLGGRAIHCLQSRWGRFAMATAAILCISSIPVPLRIVAPATLQPSNQFRHYAPMDARITKVHVDYGQSVTAGQVLLELEDRQLSNLLDDAVSQQLKSKERRRDIEARLLRGDHLPNDTRYELEGELETLRALTSNEQLRIESLRKQMELLTIRAAKDGVVATWNARQMLQDRPVRVGQILLMIHQPNGPWSADTRLNQQDVGKFLKTVRQGMPMAHCALASHPNQSIPAIYQPDASTAMISASQDNSHESTLCVKFAIPVGELPQRNAGSSARVTIDIGQGPLAWSVFGDAMVSLWAKVRLWI